MAQRVAAGDNEWQQMKNGQTNDNEWQQMTGSGKMNENEWEQEK